MPSSRLRETLAQRSEETGDVLLLPDSLAGLVEPVGTDDAYREEVVGRAETARGEVALRNGESGQRIFRFQSAVGGCAVD